MDRLTVMRQRSRLLEEARAKAIRRKQNAVRTVDKLELKKALAAQFESRGLKLKVAVSDKAAAVQLDSVEGKLRAKRHALEVTGNPAEYAEIRRICGLPVKAPLTSDEIESLNEEFLLARAYADSFRLWGVQCEALRDFRDEGGLFSPIGVGWGKTIITQSVANLAYASGITKVMLLVPSAVLVQLMQADFPFARRRVPISYPVHCFGGKSLHQRRMLARSGKRGLYVLPYSLLSQRDGSEILELVRPGLIIADEADALANRKAARTKRVMGYVEEARPKGVCLSGTITSKSIKDYYHLIKWCLDERCPLPLSANLASEWAAKIDSDARSTDSTGPIRPLVEWAQQNFPDERITEDTTGFRLAYKLRLKSTPGVVATGDAEIGCSLILHNEPSPKPDDEDPEWARLEDLRKRVVEQWLTPNGDEIEHAIHTWKWLYELSAGFYNELVFPTAGELAERESVSPQIAEQALALAKAHHVSHQNYAKALRKWLETRGRHGLDTPWLVGLDISKHGGANVGADLAFLWEALKSSAEELREFALANRVHTGSLQELDKKISRSFRDSRVIRVCSYKIDHAVDWARGRLPKGEGAIIWVEHQGVGLWAVEKLREAGLNPLHCPAGDVHNERILDPANAKRLVVASMKAHGTGKNLQAFGFQFFLQWPRNAKIAEQTLGRLHRNGQQRSEVWTYTNTTSEFDQLNFAACLNDALYIHQTTGNRQKVVYATYSPQLPKIFPSELLRERGFQNRRLDRAQQSFMNERFGLGQ